MLSSRIDCAVEALCRPGGVVCYPTETVYGIGGRAADSEAALRIAGLKGRTLQALIVLVDRLPEGLPPLAQELAQRFWPGPLTLIVPSIEGIAPEVLGPGGTLGLRWSPHPVVSALIQRVGPITSTSANRTGEPPLTDGRCTLAVDYVLDDGLLPAAEPSTIVDVQSRRVLRPGAIAGAIADYLR